MPEPNDGTNALDQGRMSADPIRGERTDVASTTLEGEGKHLPAAPQGGTGASRMTLEKMPAGMADAVQEGASFYSALEDYNSERKPETEGWQETEDDPLPRDESSTARDD